MPVNVLDSKETSVNRENTKVTSIFDYKDMGEIAVTENGFRENNIDGKDFKMLEQKLTSEMNISEAKLSGKIDTVEARMAGKIDTLTSKIDSQNKLLYWIMGIISAGIIVPLITMLIKFIIK